ncbi:MAG TPA: cation diffusion facilitator family transporter [Ferruginibacter sp.]|nr:cation diffusion facilitator family transporter [Chitinophagaceae bacterium]HRI24138.1 cation diffusion facilitator family transporter [Ferruginibacter sp.]
MQTALYNLKIQKRIAALSVVLLVVKAIAWYLTGSVAILTDAFESIVNVVAGFIGVYSLYVSAKPMDLDHPYGHGKAEFISAAIEGTMISIAGLIIIYEALNNLLHPHEIKKLDYGILLTAGTALINYAAGYFCVKTGKKNNSLALISSGKHLQSDTWTTLGIVCGLILLLITKLAWIDSAVAILFSLFIIYTGYKILRSSVAGIMDEADTALLDKLVHTLNKSRRENWIDLHNLRIIKYGSRLHLDCHLTVPWYLNVHQAHEEIDALSGLVKNEFGESVELFVHSDGCLDFSCRICSKTDCTVRKQPFEKTVEWTMENILSNNKHRIS